MGWVGFKHHLHRHKVEYMVFSFSLTDISFCLGGTSALFVGLACCTGGRHLPQNHRNLLYFKCWRNNLSINLTLHIHVLVDQQKRNPRNPWDSPHKMEWYAFSRLIWFGSIFQGIQYSSGRYYINEGEGVFSFRSPLLHYWLHYYLHGTEALNLFEWTFICLKMLISSTTETFIVLWITYVLTNIFLQNQKIWRILYSNTMMQQSYSFD